MLKIIPVAFLVVTFLPNSYAANAGSNLDAGQPHALFSEAMSHLLGRHGKPKSSELAFKKFEVLARQGWKTAQHMLGNMYFKGEGTTKDSVKAYLWYSLAASQNFSIAQDKVIYLRERLEKSKLQEAELLLGQWNRQFKDL